MAEFRADISAFDLKMLPEHNRCNLDLVYVGESSSQGCTENEGIIPMRAVRNVIKLIT